MSKSGGRHWGLSFVAQLAAFVFVLGAVTFTSVVPASAACGGPGSVSSATDQASLNAAITCFNVATSAGNYTVSIDSNITYSSAGPGVVNTTPGLSLTILGNGNTVNANGEPHVIGGGDGTVWSIDDVTLTGAASQASGSGAVLNGGSLTIADSTITGNTAGGSGGGIANGVNGTVSLINSTVTDNTSGLSAGGIFNLGTLSITDSTISGNTAGSSGGGIANGVNGTVTLINSTVTDNTSGSSGGGIVNEGTLSITDSTISGNTAIQGGGVTNLRSLSITNTTISGNDAVGGGTSGVGGGLLAVSGSATLVGSIIADNSAPHAGGGLYNAGLSTLTLSGSTVNDNTANDFGGGFFNSGVLTVSDSTISGNDAKRGGGIWAQNGARTTVTNSTISGNAASSSGGGIANVAADASVWFSTVTENSAPLGAGIFSNNAGVVTRVGGSIVAGNVGGGGDVAGLNVVSEGYNVVGDGSAVAAFTAAGDVVGVDALLGPLVDNGGPTLTHAPGPGSPAFDRVTGVVGSDDATDQRGFVRPVGSAKDSGAVEFDPCFATPWVATNTLSLNLYVECFNEQTSGSHTLTIGVATLTYTAPAIPIDNSSFAGLLIEGQGTTLDAVGMGRVMEIRGGAVTINNLTLTGGDTSGDGGGLLVEGSGGSTVVTLRDSTIRDNAAAGSGGGVSVDGGWLTFDRSTISGNTAQVGGGVHATGPDGELVMQNSTVSGNVAANDAGGVFLSAGGSSSIEFSTVTANSPGGVLIGADGSGTGVSASIIAGNPGGDDVGRFSASSPGFVSGSFNVIGVVGANVSAFGPATDDLTGQTAVDIDLGPLQLNSGSSNATETHALRPGSSAVNHVTGTITIGTDQTKDQNETSRPVGAKDAGSFEFVADDLTLLSAPCSLASGTLAVGVPQTVQVTGSCGVPASGVSAVVVSLASTSPTGGGNLRLYATGDTPAGGVVNYANNGLTNANTITVPVSAAGEVDVAANASVSGYELRVIGFYSPTGTLEYTPLTPCAAADSRSSQGASSSYVGPFAIGQFYPVIDLVGTFAAIQGGGNSDCGVPATADAVMVNVVAVGGSGGQGGLAVGTSGSTPTQATTFFSDIGLNNAASMIVPLDGDQTISAAVSSLGGSPSSHIRIVVLGYYEQDTGSDYIPTNPCTAFDTRVLNNDPDNTPTGAFVGQRTAGNSAASNFTGTTTYNVTGTIPAEQGGTDDCGVPEGATGVLINLVGIAPTAAGNLRAFATGSSPTGGVLNFANLTPSMNNSNAIVVPVDANGNLDVFVNAPSNVGNPTIHTRGVILGYYN